MRVTKAGTGAPVGRGCHSRLSVWPRGQRAELLQGRPSGRLGRPPVTQPCSPLLQVWLVMHEVPRSVKPVLQRLQFLLEPSQLRQFASHLRGDTHSCHYSGKRPSHSRSPSGSPHTACVHPHCCCIPHEDPKPRPSFRICFLTSDGTTALQGKDGHSRSWYRPRSPRRLT